MRGLTAGFTGPGLGGKTWLGTRICGAAGVNPARAMIETSKYITGLAELLRLRLIELTKDGHDLSAPHMTWLAIAEISDWLALTSGGMLKVPQTAFDLRRSELSDIGLLIDAIDAFRLHPERYAVPITIDNKSTPDNRIMLTGVNVVTSRLAARYLRLCEGINIQSVWPWLAMRELDAWSDEAGYVPFGAICGLRLPGDDDAIRLLGGPIVFRARYRRHRAPRLYTEQPHIEPDLLVLGEPPVEGLDRYADRLWGQWSATPRFLPVPRSGRIVRLARMAVAP
jgi:hypothetical protein